MKWKIKLHITGGNRNDVSENEKLETNMQATTTEDKLLGVHLDKQYDNNNNNLNSAT